MEPENLARKQPAESGQIRNQEQKKERPIRRSVRRKLLLREAGACGNKTSGRARKKERASMGSTWLDLLPRCPANVILCCMSFHVRMRNARQVSAGQVQ